MSHHLRAKYDKVFGQESDQMQVFHYVQDSIKNVINGFNCTIFAYGQTGSGKTYTMFGKVFDEQPKRPRV
jgi:type II secretory ATPase GspE/PulE/Tfp pilus assembly ATPase PilB-like protein